MSDLTLLIEEYGAGHAVAALENGRLIDFLIDSLEQKDWSMVGSIMTAKLHDPLKGVNGTFVTLPNNKKGFLRGAHDFPKHSVVPVYVGVQAEPYKAQPVTTKLLLKGRYVILTPDSPGVNISREIRSEDKRNTIFNGLLKMSDKLPTKCGLIVRSQAINIDIEDIIKETNEKIAQYDLILKDDRSKLRIIIDPIKARERAILDWSLNESNLIIEEESCFDVFSVWEQVSEFLKTRVELANGGFIMIESTSALVAVDVNTGADVSYAGALKTNLLTMRELPRQLEIRGLGGKIVVELAPLSKKDRLKVEIELKMALEKYKSQCAIVGWTKLGNLELQKKRHKQSISKVLRNDNRFKLV
ncbi:MAG: ribonuclease E/G [Paracoccaceae bacterium]|nr:ribonuclease E/G [Paracoccaceae bacterium]